MPATFMTYPGSSEPILPTRRNRLGRVGNNLRLEAKYLWSFGTVTVPMHLWRAFVRFDAWIEPALVAEWIRVMEGYAERQGRRLDPGTVAKAMIWHDPSRDVSFARRRALHLLEQDGLHCVWTGRRLTAERLDIDHCLPWAAWPCEDLWNLMPSSPSVNRHGKSGKLPSQQALSRCEDKIMSWWSRAWTSQPETVQRFTEEARTSLPVPADREGLEAIFTGLQGRRFAIRADQQVAEWTPK
jgi:hypothetical protein